MEFNFSKHLYVWYCFSILYMKTLIRDEIYRIRRRKTLIYIAKIDLFRELEKKLNGFITIKENIAI